VAGISAEIVQQTAKRLYDAERERKTLRPLTESHPDMEPAEAYRIQLALTELRKAAGQRIVGKKIGLTSKAMQRMLDVDQPDYGHLFDNMMVQGTNVGQTILRSFSLSRPYFSLCGPARPSAIILRAFCVLVI